MSNPLKSLLGQTAIYGLPTIIGRLLNYFLVPLYTGDEAFTPSEYGTLSELYAYVAFLIILLPLGMETAFFRYINKHDNNAEIDGETTQEKSIFLISYQFKRSGPTQASPAPSSAPITECVLEMGIE